MIASVYSVGILLFILSLEIFQKECLSSEISFEYLEGAIFVPAKINGKEVSKMVLDTGATEMILTPTTAKRLGVSKGAREGEFIEIDQFKVGDAALERGQLYLYDPPQALSLRLNYGIDYAGIIGFPFFSKFVCTIDYFNKNVSFETMESWKKKDGFVYYEFPLEINDRHPFIKVSIQGKGPMRMLCDTGATDTLLIHRAAERWGFKGQPMVHPEGASFFNADSIDLGEIRLSQFPIVIHTPPQVEVYGSSYDGILGNNFLSRFVVTFDYKNGKVFFATRDKKK